MFFNYSRVVSGLQLMAWGFFKKVVIADRLSILVDAVYNDPKHHSNSSLLVATFFFCYQIFCDFSGYTDIALGAARIMGFELLKNFNKPYHAKTISDFWSRWHISLSTWFRDYLYIPLGGNRVGKYRWYFNLFLVFLISGFWHGAAWTFIIWGALHGIFSVLSIITKRYNDSVRSFLNSYRLGFISIITTFLMVAYAWIFFRANNISDALYIAKHILTDLPDSLKQPGSFLSENLGLRKGEIILSFGLIAFLEVVHNISDIRRRFYTISAPLRLALYTAAVLIIIFFGEFSERQFIYFQF